MTLHREEEGSRVVGVRPPSRPEKPQRSTQTIMEGLLTHVAKADCFLTLPHPALECGIVTAWWRGVEAEHPSRAEDRTPHDLMT